MTKNYFAGTEPTHSRDDPVMLPQLQSPGSGLPSFVRSDNDTSVTSVGQTVYLYCGVNNLGDRQV